ncbi:MAG: thiamine pyrophosphate-binding protein [Chloroflexi bacterium]|nr:thiamine pyrophosphate-binding protein [Chloroflexota bacterium]
MPVLTADEVLVECLKNEGIRFIFGSPGDEHLSLLDYLYRDGAIRFFDTRHENTGVLAALGYSQATGGPAVCTGTVGSGVANMFNGLYCAWRSRAPVVAIVCKHGPGLWERDSIKSFDQSACFQPITKWTVDVDRIEHLPDALQRAFRVATAPPTGPVMVCINENLLQCCSGPQLDIELPPRERYHPASPLTYADPSLVQKAARLLVEAQFPLLLADDRTFWNGSEAELAQLAEALAAPVFQAGKNFRPLLPEDSPLAWGFLNLATVGRAREIRGQCDLLLAVDCTFDSSITTGAAEHPIGWEPKRFPERIIQIDSDAHFIGKFYPVEVGILGHSKAVLGQILQAVRDLGVEGRQREKRLEMLRQAKKDWLAFLEAELDPVREKVPIDPLLLVREMSRAMDSRDLVVVGGATIRGVFEMLGAFLAPAPRMVFGGGYEGSLGQALARSMGLKLAHPHKRVTALCGDGEFWFGNASELETLKRHRLPIPIVISNNGAFGNMLNRQRQLYQERFIGTHIDNPDFSYLARAFDMYSETVVEPRELPGALKRALECGRPALVDVHTDPFATLPGRRPTHR